MLKRKAILTPKIKKKMDLLMYSSDILNLTEIVKNRLYFAVVTPEVVLKNTSDTLFFNVDNEYVYLNFYYDFGPLNISCLYKYCYLVNEYLQNGEYKRIVHCTSSEPHLKANAAFLIGSFAVIYLKVQPLEMTKALVAGCFHFMPFNDASQGGSEWKINLIDCFSAIQKAFHFGFINFNDFDVNEYDNYDKLQNGDMNWLLPKKFVAFIGPTDLELMNYHSPDFYVQYFILNHIKAVIRLNNNTYNPAVFTAVGIEHYDLFFPDGSTPPKHILNQFLSVSENTRGALAVHCKAGLGRTGSLIGAFIIKHYRFTARETIAWLRICRPGSVIGQQQGWLEHMEPWLLKQGNYFRFHHYGHIEKIPRNKFGIYSIIWKKERIKIMKIMKEKELQSATELTKCKFSSSSTIESASVDTRFVSSTSTANSKILGDTMSIKGKVVDKGKARIVKEIENISGTQGDKLNYLKSQKQKSNIPGSSFMTDKVAASALRSKNQFSFTTRKPEISNKKK